MDTAIEPIQVQSLKEACAARLEQMILSGELEIGERLPSERSFAARLNVSRPVLHQALVDLEAKGLVRILPRRGVFISDYRRDGSLAMLSSLLSYHNGALSPDLNQSMLDMRMLLETETARLAAQYRTEVQMGEFRELLAAEIMAADSDPQTLTDLDFSFHHSIAIASGNLVYPLIINSFKDVYTGLTGIFFRRYFGTQVITAVHAYHQQLVVAFESRDTDSAVGTMLDMLKHGEGYLKGESPMTTQVEVQPRFEIKSPTNLSARIQWLRDYYFQGVKRNWNNEYTSWTTGTPWDFQYNELSFYIVPETYGFLQTFRSAFKQTAHLVDLHSDFWTWSLPERRAWFNKEVMVGYLPKEILPGDLIAGGRFNIMTSACLTKQETRLRDQQVYGKNGTRAAIIWFHDHGYGNVGATSGHLIPDYARVLRAGWKSVYEELEAAYQELSPSEQRGQKGGQLRGMMTAATMPRDLAHEYSRECNRLADSESDPARRQELLDMADMLTRVPWEPRNHVLGGGPGPVVDPHAGHG